MDDIYTVNYAWSRGCNYCNNLLHTYSIYEWLRESYILAFMLYLQNTDSSSYLKSFWIASLSQARAAAVSTDSETIFVPARNGLAKEERWKNFAAILANVVHRCCVALSPHPRYKTLQLTPIHLNLAFPGTRT